MTGGQVQKSTARATNSVNPEIFYWDLPAAEGTKIIGPSAWVDAEIDFTATAYIADNELTVRIPDRLTDISYTLKAGEPFVVIKGSTHEESYLYLIHEHKPGFLRIKGDDGIDTPFDPRTLPLTKISVDAPTRMQRFASDAIKVLKQ